MPYYNAAQRQTAVFEVGEERRGILCVTKKPGSGPA